MREATLVQPETGKARPTTGESVTATVKRLGECLELISMDPHFNDITVGLFAKDGVLTVWSYSRREGVAGRLEQIRDRLVLLGGLSPSETSPRQATSSCGELHLRPLRFLMMKAVERPPDEPVPTGEITVKDLRSPLLLKATPSQDEGRWVYTVSGEGEFERPEARYRAVIGGLMRYGDMERLAPDRASFTCGARHDELVRILFRYARNISAVEEMLEAQDLAGQMTTQTLGFSTST